MLQTLREKVQGAMTWIIVVVIVSVFALLGFSDYFTPGGGGYAAKVGDEKISWRAVDTLYERALKQYGHQANPRQIKDQVRMALVRRAAVLSNTKAIGFQIGEEQVANLLLQIPVFQEEGKFSKERYLKILKQEGFTDSSFRQEISQDLLIGQLEQGIASSSFILPNELNTFVALLDQKRDFGYAILPVKKFQQDIKIASEDIQKYYDDHKGEYIKPEQVTLEYVILSVDALAKEVQVSTADVLAYYNEHKVAYTLPERVNARHILITAPKGNVEQDKEAKGKMAELQAELKKGTEFAALAKKASQDTGSAAKGGDLGWFVKGDMVPEFEKAAFELKKPGDVSDPVRTQFGYHLIQLIEHKPTEIRPFEAVQALAEEQLKREKAQALFIEKGERLARLAFENTKELAPAAAEVGLKVQETEPLGREGTKKGIASSPEVMKIAFSEPVLDQHNNSEPIKLSEGETAIIRVKNHFPAAQQTLAEAEKNIQEKLSQDLAKEKVQSIGQTFLESIQSGKDPRQVAKELNLEWILQSKIARLTPPETLDRLILMRAFETAYPNLTTGKPGVQGFNLPSGDYVVLAVSQVIPGDYNALTPEVQNAYRQSLSDASSQFEYAMYVNQAMQNAKIELAKEEPAS